MTKTIFMGLNQEPHFVLPEKFDTFNEDLQKYWKREVEDALKLKEEIEEVMAEEGKCNLYWECTGRTRHEMHSNQWARALPQYNFEISYQNYGCKVTTKGAK